MNDDKVLHRNVLLAGASNLKRQLIEIKELDGSLYIRQIGTAQLLLLKDKLEKMGDKNNMAYSSYLDILGSIVALSVCDKDGQLLYTDEDIPKITENSFSVLLEISNAVFQLSNLTLNLPEGVNKPSIRNEVADDLKNGGRTSSSSSSQGNYIKQRKRSKSSQQMNT